MIKLNVGMKLGLGFALALVILLVIGIVSLGNSSKLMHTAQSMAHAHAVLRSLESVLSVIKDGETGQRGYLLTGDEKYLEPYLSARTAIDKEFNTLRGLVKDIEQKRRLEALEPLITGRDGRFAMLEETIEARKDPARGANAALEIVRTDKGRQVMDDIRKRVREMQDEQELLLKTRAAEAETSARYSTATILYGTLAAFAFLGVAGFLITRDIADPLKLISANAERIAGGDLSVAMPATDRGDEVGVLIQTFSRMTDSLKGMAAVAGRIASGDLRVKVQPQSDKDVLGNAFASMVENLQSLTADLLDGVNVLASAANEISATTTQMAASASESATAVSETTTTVEEVRQTAQLASQKSKLVSDAAQTAAQIAQGGRKSAEEAIAGSARIRQQMESIAGTMMRLSEQGHAVGQIIATVEDLAAQSTLLAVNAAIEATRAGEHGKSFGVVAQEVKSLAEQSRQATKQVRTILVEFQKATAAAVMATEQGTKAVEVGGRQTEAAGESIQSLAGSVNEASHTATQIAASSQQQLVGMDQMVLAMENIRQASTQNVSSARQLETAAHNLTGLGQRLKRMVERYKI
jgi:methyl-accepting chemotaxis protein